MPVWTPFIDLVLLGDAPLQVYPVAQAKRKEPDGDVRGLPSDFILEAPGEAGPIAIDVVQLGYLTDDQHQLLVNGRQVESLALGQRPAGDNPLADCGRCSGVTQGGCACRGGP